MVFDAVEARLNCGLLPILFQSWQEETRLKTKRVSSCLAGGEGLLGSELLQFCQNAAHEHAVGEGEAWLAPGAGRG